MVGRRVFLTGVAGAVASRQAMAAELPPIGGPRPVGLPGAAQDSTVLYRAGDKDSSGKSYVQIRIPVIVSLPSDVVLAFAEPAETPGDFGVIRVAVRRSTDGGDTFGPWKLITTGGGTTVVVDPASQDVVLMITRAGPTAAQPYPMRPLVLRSTDAGVTWSAPTDISSQIKRPGEQWFATGPGTGIVITAGPASGRLIMPVYFTRPPAGWTEKADGSDAHRWNGVRLCYSDDGGRSWQAGAEDFSPDNVVNPGETAVTTLADRRTIYASARLETSLIVPANRADTYSDDGGLSFTYKFRPNHTVTTPRCQGSLITLPDGRLVYCGPSAGDVRGATALRISDDDGHTWYLRRYLSGLPGAYSTMALSNDSQTLLVLHEEGDFSLAHKRIRLTRVPVAALDR